MICGVNAYVMSSRKLFIRWRWVLWEILLRKLYAKCLLSCGTYFTITFTWNHFHQSLPQAGGDAALTAASPARRTFSGASVDSVPSLPEISVSSSDLASYVHQLRTYLPKASILIDGKPADSAVSDSVGTESRSEVYSRPEFMDRSITSRWDKQTPKVRTSFR